MEISYGDVVVEFEDVGELTVAEGRRSLREV
jgi:hypothetical protein